MKKKTYCMRRASPWCASSDELCSCQLERRISRRTVGLQNSVESRQSFIHLLTSHENTFTFAWSLRWSIKLERFWNFLLHTLQMCFRFGSSKPASDTFFGATFLISNFVLLLPVGLRMPVRKETASEPPAPHTFVLSKFFESWLLSSSSSIVSYSKYSSYSSPSPSSFMFS